MAYEVLKKAALPFAATGVLAAGACAEDEPVPTPTTAPAIVECQDGLPALEPAKLPPRFSHDENCTVPLYDPNDPYNPDIHYEPLQPGRLIEAECAVTNSKPPHIAFNIIGQEGLRAANLSVEAQRDMYENDNYGLPDCPPRTE